MQWVYGCAICCMCVRLCVYNMCEILCIQYVCEIVCIQYVCMRLCVNSMCVRLQDRDYTHNYKQLNWLIRQNREVGTHQRERDERDRREREQRDGSFPGKCNQDSAVEFPELMERGERTEGSEMRGRESRGYLNPLNSNPGLTIFLAI